MSPTHATQAGETQSRPRVEGEREQEILDATIDILAEVGYDRLTMDAVAARAKASKATLYRRWNGKAQLVIDALISEKEPMTAPDTGSLREDLVGTFCGMGGLTDTKQIAIFGSVVTAMSRDPEFAETFRRDFIGPKKAISTELFRRAQERGELRDGLDLELIALALPGIVLHRTFLLGDPPTPELIAKVVDQLIIPAVTRG
ncbi:TetR/AcrR family transcriptional regulator [Nocardioides antri]|uniref:TetR/AcrR family transcriptional regulator n=1 Tax=Nocardioides antri TaxID=2607659 RepID=A0A5B1LYS2_9ACTN|nr:TetR/AcrR family transcriptional regulator [Nocardioides antri]KAA1425644.1 TetR/AcrR family transcriptional regulator [Nocardioides antri]